MTDSIPIILILPAFNEGVALGPLLSTTAITRATHLQNLTVIVVNDGSTDDTALVVNAARLQNGNDSWLTLVSHPVNMGLAQAMRTGIAQALQVAPTDGLIASMDADNSHQPSEMVRMVDRIRAGADVVIGSRFQAGAEMRGIPRHRQLFSVGVSILFRMFCPIVGVRDFSCGYRIYRASALRRATAVFGEKLITEQGFACMTEVLLKMSQLPGLRFVETPICLRYDRKPGLTKMKVWQNVKDMIALMWRLRAGSMAAR